MHTTQLLVLTNCCTYWTDYSAKSCTWESIQTWSKYQNISTKCTATNCTQHRPTLVTLGIHLNGPTASAISFGSLNNNKVIGSLEVAFAGLFSRAMITQMQHCKLNCAHCMLLHVNRICSTTDPSCKIGPVLTTLLHALYQTMEWTKETYSRHIPFWQNLIWYCTKFAELNWVCLAIMPILFTH